MQAGVDKAAARPQAPGHLAEDAGKVLQVSVEEHADHDRERLVPYRQRARVGPGHRVEPAPGEAELIGRDVEADGPVAGLSYGRRAQAGTAGQVDAHLPAAGAEGLPQEGEFFRAGVAG